MHPNPILIITRTTLRAAGDDVTAKDGSGDEQVMPRVKATAVKDESDAATAATVEAAAAVEAAVEAAAAAAAAAAR